MRTIRYSWLLCLMLAVITLPTLAQTYPTKPIRVIAGGAGGSGDTVTRIVVAELGALGQPILVENHPGSVMVSVAAKSAPDGYTLLTTGGTLWVAPLFNPAPYDMRHFVAVATATRAPSILVIHPSLPVKSVPDLIRLLKAKPGEFNYSSGPIGGSTYVAFEVFKSMAGVNIVGVLYKDAQETTDLISGQVHMTMGAASSTWAPQIKAGKLRAIATAGSVRSLLYPDLPTVAETLPGYEADQVLGFFAPAGTPDAIVRRLNTEIGRALDKPPVRERLLKLGVEPAGGTPEQFAATINADIARVSKLIKDLGIKPGS